MSGLCVAIALLRSGITDVTIYEKADEVGGTWRDNTYPGLVCDIPSRIYQYTFARNPDWSHLFSPGGEIQAYFSGVADRFGLRDRIRFGTEIVRCPIRRRPVGDTHGLRNASDGGFPDLGDRCPASSPDAVYRRFGRFRWRRFPLGTLGSRRGVARAAESR